MLEYELPAATLAQLRVERTRLLGVDGVIPTALDENDDDDDEEETAAALPPVRDYHFVEFYSLGDLILCGGGHTDENGTYHGGTCEVSIRLVFFFFFLSMSWRITI